MHIYSIAMLSSFWQVLEGHMELSNTTCSSLYLSIIANVFEDLQFSFCIKSHKLYGKVDYGVNWANPLNETRQDPSQNVLLWGPSAKGQSWRRLCSSPQCCPTS